MTRLAGTVQNFSTTRGFGFIDSTDGERFFAHFSQVRMPGYKTLKVGEEVTFETAPAAPGAPYDRAIHIDVGEAAPARPARMQRSRATDKWRNPFREDRQGRIAPQGFVGRDTEIRTLLSCIIDGVDVAIGGPRGIGKTELLRQIRRVLSGKRELIESRRAALGQRIADHPLKSDCINARLEYGMGTLALGVQWLTALDAKIKASRRATSWSFEASVNLGFGRITASRETASASDNLAAEDAMLRAELLRALTAYFGETVDADLRLVFFVDELETGDVDALFGSFIKSLHEDIRDREVWWHDKVSFVLSGAGNVKTYLNKSGIKTDPAFRLTYLDRLSDAFLFSIIVESLTLSGVRIDGELVQKIVSLAKGSPDTLQSLCYWCFEAATEEEIDNDAVETGLAAFKQQLDRGDFVVLRQSSNWNNYVILLAYIAAQKGEWVALSDVRENSSLTNSQIGQYLAILERRTDELNNPVIVRETSAQGDMIKIQDPTHATYFAIADEI